MARHESCSLWHYFPNNNFFQEEMEVSCADLSLRLWVRLNDRPTPLRSLPMVPWSEHLQLQGCHELQWLQRCHRANPEKGFCQTFHMRIYQTLFCWSYIESGRLKLWDISWKPNRLCQVVHSERGGGVWSTQEEWKGNWKNVAEFGIIIGVIIFVCFLLNTTFLSITVYNWSI